MLADQLVVDGDRVRDAGQPAAARRVEAQQADQVGAVGVVVEGDAAELVAAGGGVVDALALVGDVAEDVAVVVLGPRLPEMQPDAPVQQRELGVGVPVDVERGDADEASTVQQVADDLARACRRGRPAGSRRGRARAGCRCAPVAARKRTVQLRVVGRGELHRPVGGVRDVRGAPLGGRLQLGAVRRHLLGRAHRGLGWGPRTSRPGRAPVATPSRAMVWPATTVAV